MQSVQEAEELVKVRASIFERGMGICWAIVLKDNLDHVIGSCGYYKLVSDDRSVEVGYDLHPMYWRQGFMTEALNAVIDFAYSDRFFFSLYRWGQAGDFPSRALKSKIIIERFYQGGETQFI